MRTLVVNCNNVAEKIIPYLEFIKDYTEYTVVEDIEVSESFDISNFDAILISGSNKNLSHGQFQRSFIDFLRELNAPTIGICYGFQILTYAYGGKVRRLENKIKGDKAIDILDQDIVFKGLSSPFVASESHEEYISCDDAVFQNTLKLLAKSNFNSICIAEAMKVKDKPIYGFQFHIERSKDVGKQILSNFYTYVVKG